jgi:endonuclease/exonuclease/phosphatase family metal-dependent hydrolase
VLFAPADSAVFGNALLTPFAVLKSEIVYLKPVANYNRRSLLLAQLLVTPEGCGAAPRAFEPFVMAVGALHLDHISESMRMQQLTLALDHVTKAYGLSAATATAPSSAPVLLCGDFNALSTRDYSAKEWERIAQVRKKKSWEPPQTRVTELLQRSGWIDPWHPLPPSAAAGSDLPPSGAPASGAGEGPRLTAHTKKPMYRIDYVWLSPHFLAPRLQAAPGSPSSAAVAASTLTPKEPRVALSLVPARMAVDTKATASDHFPVLLDLTVLSKPTPKA